MRVVAIIALLSMLASTALAHPPAAQPISPIDLNQASAEELVALPGIGPTKAKAIVAARQKRHFVRTAELLRIKGIGRKTLRRLRPYLRVNSAR